MLIFVLPGSPYRSAYGCGGTGSSACRGLCSDHLPRWSPFQGLYMTLYFELITVASSDTLPVGGDPSLSPGRAPWKPFPRILCQMWENVHSRSQGAIHFSAFSLLYRHAARGNQAFANSLLLMPLTCVLSLFEVRNARKLTVHTTGKKCPRPSCGGALRDCVVSNGEHLPEIPIR